MAQVVRASHTGRQASLLVRTSGPIPDPAWTAHEVTLEDVVLTYLANPSAGALPGPAARNDRLEVQDELTGVAPTPPAGPVRAAWPGRAGRPPDPHRAADPVQARQERASQFASRYGGRGVIGVLLWFLPLFALALGVFAGALTRRTQVEFLARAHYLPPAQLRHRPAAVPPRRPLLAVPGHRDRPIRRPGRAPAADRHPPHPPPDLLTGTRRLWPGDRRVVNLRHPPTSLFRPGGPCYPHGLITWFR